MNILKLFGASVIFLGVFVFPSFVSAQSCAYDSYGVWSCNRTTLNVYVQVVNQYGQSRSPHDFQITVSGSNPTPSSFSGSSNGTVVTLGANQYYSVSSSGYSGYITTYSGACSGTLYTSQQATCIVTQNAQSNYPYPQPYPYPYPPQQPPVIIMSTYVPRALPNTGFDPNMGSAMLAFATVLLIGSGFVVYPYVRKAFTSIR